MLQKELEHTPSVKTDAAAAFLASLEEPKLTSLAEAGKKPPIEVLPPGMQSLSAAPISIQKKPQQQPAKPLALEAPPMAAPPVSTPPPQSDADPTTTPVSSEPPPPASDTVAAPVSDPVTEPVSDSVAPTANVPPSNEEAAS